MSLNDGRWHHICITWTTRDGLWETYQNGQKVGSGENLAPWHPIKPDGVLILGQEQVRIAAIVFQKILERVHACSLLSPFLVLQGELTKNILLDVTELLLGLCFNICRIDTANGYIFLFKIVRTMFNV